MKLAPIAAALFALAFSQTAHAQWRDAQGKPLPDSPSRQSKDGFSAMLVVTDDAHWKDKVANTPEADKPSFNEVREVHLGGKITVLTLFAGVAVDKDGKAHIECAAEMKLPSGKIAQAQPWITCAQGEVKGSVKAVRVLPLQLGFKGEETDPEGSYPVVVHVRDKVRGVELELKTEFTYRKKG